METVRLRVVFEDRRMLSKLQKSEGLKRSWLLLKPQHETISDISSHLIDAFELGYSCPNGIILSMDGFVLPSFESACILKDKDEIRVNKKKCMLFNISKADEGQNLIQEEDIVDKQPMVSILPLLANEEFEKEIGGYESETEEEDNQSEDASHLQNSGGDVVSKKRKASECLQSAKKKRKCHMPPEAIENNLGAEENKNSQNGELPEMNISKEEEVSTVKRDSDRASTRGITKRSNNKAPKRAKRSTHPQENSVARMESCDISDTPRKVPSRSARRKKAKRKWLRELVKAEKKEIESSKLSQNEEQSPAKDKQKDPIEYHKPDHNIEADDEIVPIVIRPGHIRFEPLGKDHVVQENQLSIWNGITSKKKGQKWGKEKVPSSRRNYSKDLSKGYSDAIAIEKETQPDGPMDFEKLAALTTLPQDGDVIAYRLLELSSSWTPELSSFRVGKTSRYDAQSNVILLTPVPEYPVVEKKADEDASEQPDNSLYREDGSLEIDFSSLVDVRIVKPGNQDPAKAINGRVNECSAGSKDAEWSTMHTATEKPPHAASSEVNVWDEISEALSAKKTQLLEESGWGNVTSGKSSWSYRALRGSALGPTMAYLRARNNL